MSQFSVTASNESQVIAYLQLEYAYTYNEASALVDRFHDIYEQGVCLGSFVYYIGDRMADADTRD